MSSVFDTARETLGWGKEAILDFKGICESFFASDPYSPIEEIEPDTGEQVYKLVPSVEFPLSQAARRATEAIQNTKNSFDQAMHAACVALDSRLSKETIYFPWADSPTGVGQRLNGKTKKIPQALWGVVQSLEPYGTGNGYSGGDDVSRKLAQIANRKHTVGIALTPHADLTGATLALGGDYTLVMAWNPVNGEIIIRRGTRMPGGKEHYSINIDVVFDQSTPLNRFPVLKGLRSFAAKADKALTALEQAIG